ncbi:Lactoylglutathione lyase [Acidisarcina polymorpha]|uniref:Lactoylglutathione lyase n=1 Tax=Acidisarcina polymorpha TaxID=2211140 RepID=A0A2Z5G695_9BACT|nr:VOC family protein [Acidisarcina polymorpha]AXC14499.1 Lactoylglutathione lyase [Acidisarcina polymorpha]
MKVSSSATVFQVKDLSAALHFYCEVLGFEKDFEYGPYAGVHWGECYLHLCVHTTWNRPVGGGAISVFADEVDEYCTLTRGRGAKIELEPTNEPYGMRDFVVSDPDGNILTFGCALAEDVRLPTA